MFHWLTQFKQRFFNQTPEYARHVAGKRAEKLAERHLRAQGLTLMARNFLCKNGELDRVMRDGEYLVFVEVRYRAQGGALESVLPAKQQAVARCAHWYLQTQRLGQRQAQRFDLVLVTGNLDAPQIEWIQDAFRL